MAISTLVGAQQSGRVFRGRRARRTAGRAFAPNDLSWREGMANWQPLCNLRGLGGGTRRSAHQRETSTFAGAGSTPKLRPGRGVSLDSASKRIFQRIYQGKMVLANRPALHGDEAQGGLGEPRCSTGHRRKSVNHISSRFAFLGLVFSGA
jgi:hypothetical protein